MPGCLTSASSQADSLRSLERAASGSGWYWGGLKMSYASVAAEPPGFYMKAGAGMG